MKKLYIGCSLYNATPEFRTSVEEFKNSVRSDFEVLDFLGHNAGTSEEIVKYDLDQVRSSDIFLAICDVPSIGLGIEIGTANAMGKKILLVAQSRDVTNMARGNHAENSNSKFETYTDFVELKKKLLEFAQD